MSTDILNINGQHYQHDQAAEALFEDRSGWSAHCILNLLEEDVLSQAVSI